MELTQSIRDFLDQPHFAVVATIAPDGTPHQTVMWVRAGWRYPAAEYAAGQR